MANEHLFGSLSETLEYQPCEFILDGVPQCDFGFRTFEQHLSDYDLFWMFKPCWRKVEIER